MPQNTEGALRTLSKSGMRQQLSKEQWNSLKPLIRRLYMEENKTFEETAKALHETHGFLPTKKQFMDRVKPWGFNKNTRKADRRAILQTLDSVEDGLIMDQRGRKHKKLKVERWKRELERGGPVASLPFHQPKPTAASKFELPPHPLDPSALVELPAVTSSDALEWEGKSSELGERVELLKLLDQERNLTSNPISIPTVEMVPPDAMEVYSPSSKSALLGDENQRPELLHEEQHTLPEFSTSTDGSDTVHGAELVAASSELVEEIERSQLPGEDLSRSANVDAPGSPKLTWLVEILRRETNGSSYDIESIALSAIPFVSKPRSARKYVTGSELTTISRNGTHPFYSRINGSTGVADTDADFSVSCGYSVPQSGQKTLTKWMPFKYNNTDVWFPSGAEFPASPNPFNELYPFPDSTNHATRKSKSSKTLMQSYQMEEIEHSNKVQRLKMSGMHETHPAVLMAMEDLADAYSSQAKHKQAEYWYRKLLSVKRNTSVVPSVSILSLQINLVGSIGRQGRIDEAVDMFQGVYKSISNNFAPHQQIFRRALQTMENILVWTEQDEEGEAASRKLVQICLSEFGPKHSDTLDAISRLGSWMARSNRYTESIELQSIAIQLYQGVESQEDDFWRALNLLGGFVEDQGRLKEATALYRQCIEKGKDYLGEEHAEILSCCTELSRVLRKQNLLVESAQSLSKTLRLQTKAFGEEDYDVYSTLCELGATLYAMGNYQEAATHLKRSFRGSLKMFGPASGCTVYNAGWLGNCYEAQGLYEDALGLYREMIGKIRSEKGDDHPSIINIQGWIDSPSEQDTEDSSDEDDIGLE